MLLRVWRHEKREQKNVGLLVVGGEALANNDNDSAPLRANAVSKIHETQNTGNVLLFCVALTSFSQSKITGTRGPSETVLIPWAGCFGELRVGPGFAGRGVASRDETKR